MESRRAGVPAGAAHVVDARPAEDDDRDVVVHGYQFIGPMPDPMTLADYEKVFPGLGRDIATSFFKEGEHRRAQEVKLVNASIKTRVTGQWLGFVLCLVAIGGGVAIAMSHAVWSAHLGGSVMGGTGLAGLAYVFVSGRASPKPEPTNDDEEKPKSSEK
jgi:uncharacterized membrane protein